MTRRLSELPVAVVDRALQLVRDRTGLVFGKARIPGFAESLAAMMRHSGITHAAEYLRRLEHDQVLLDELVVEITVGETYFFRDNRQFALLRDEILPTLTAGTSGRQLRFWSAACSSGEEAYTLAILLEAAGLARTSQVVGSDVSRLALERARRASYTRWSLRGVDEHTVDRYFVRRGRRFDLVPAIRDAVEFKYLNLAADRYPSLVTGIGNMDVILCRNVLIYFDLTTIATVARRLIASLSADGWLLLGAADPPLRELVQCEVVATDAGLAYRRSQPGSRSNTADTHPAWRGARARGSVAVERDTSHPTRMTASCRSRPTTEARSDRVPLPQPSQAVATDAAGAAAQSVRALVNSGELPAADAACMAALKKHPLHPELVYLHAVLLTEAGRHADAAAALRRALYLDRNLAVAHIALGDVLARMGDERGAVRAFANAERLLASVPEEQVVPASDDEKAGRLLTMVRTRRSLTECHVA